MTRFALIAETFELPVAIATVADLEDAHPDEPLKLAEAAWLPELAGAFSEKQLRSAVHSGRLPAMKAGRTMYVTRRGVADWRTACRVSASRHASGSNQSAGTPQERSPTAAGSSETDRRRSARGCSALDHSGAARALERYLASIHSAKPLPKNKPAHEILVADILRHYLNSKAGDLAGASLVAIRFGHLLAFWGDKTLDDVDSATCKAYVAFRKPYVGGARRELEDLRSALNLAIADKLCREAVKVTLPQKPQPRKDYLERDAVARLVWRAYRKREIQTIHRGPRKGEQIETKRRPMRQIARFILFALYTGTRSGRVWRASFVRKDGHPWIDVENGIFYREAPGETASKTKRAPSIRIPGRLLAHLRRWKDGGHDPALGTTFLCEYHKGKPGDPKKGFRRLVDEVLKDEGSEIVRHSLRHTAATWLLQGEEDPHAVAGYLGMRTDTLIKVYGHHHPDYQESIGASFTKGKAGRKKGRKAA